MDKTIEAAIKAASDATGVDYNTLVAFSYIESGFKTGAVSQTGVRGPFQMEERTYLAYAPKVAVLNKQTDKISYIKETHYSTDFDKQAMSAAFFLKDLLKTYGSLELAAIAYNAGPEVAHNLKGKDLTNLANFESAVANAPALLSRLAPHGVGAKAKALEVFNYVPRLRKALGGDFSNQLAKGFTTGNSSDVGASTRSNIITNYVASEPIIDTNFKYDSKKSFLTNLGASIGVQRVAANAKLAIVTHSDPHILKDKIAHSKLSPILGKA